MKKLVFFVLLLFSGLVSAQSPLAAASQALKLPGSVNSVAIWPVELKSGVLDEGILNAVSDFVEQTLARRAKEKQIKVMTRRQLGNVLDEIELSSSDKTSFEKLAKATPVDAVILPSATLSKSGCLSVVINVIGAKGDMQGEVISAAKPFKVNVRSEEIDFAGCD
jgi:hypothetical protein